MSRIPIVDTIHEDGLAVPRGRAELDVVYLPEDDPVLAAPNLVVASHGAAMTEEVLAPHGGGLRAKHPRPRRAARLRHARDPAPPDSLSLILKEPP